MLQLLKRMGMLQQESNRNFNLVSAIIMLLLMLTFVGTTLYILISSLNG